MFERDYLMRMIADFMEGIRRSLELGERKDDPASAARSLDRAIGAATDFDGQLLLSLAPESMAGILSVSGTDPRVTEYIVRSLLLASCYHARAGEAGLAQLREEQARALAAAYGHELPDVREAPDAMEAFLAEADDDGC